MGELCLLELLLLVFCCNAQDQTDYFVDAHRNCSNVYNAQSTKWVRFLGIFSSTNECISKCLANSTTNDQCESYTYYTPSYNSTEYKSHCYGRFGKQYGLLWVPIFEHFVNCGRVIYKCSSDLDCSLNGKCSLNGNCSCFSAWSGYHCQTLNLLNATKGTGYHIINDTKHNNRPTSSWGGSVLIDINSTNKDTKYHMYLAEFDNNCGVNSWTLNSVVTHAQSTQGYNSPFERVSVIHEHFAHEPDAINGPNGEIVLYYAAYNFSGVPECQCTDGSTPPSCKPPNRKFINIMQYAEPSNFDGPWTRTVIFPERPVTDTDTNLSGVILKNGSFIGLERTRNGTSGPRPIYLVTSINWKNGSEYKQHPKVLFPEINARTEDPFIYIDCNGYYHAIFHNEYPEDWPSLCGAHAFSLNAIDWIYGGLSYGGTVQFTDNTNFSFTRRERPHLEFADDKCTPIALTNGAEYGGEYGDATYTLLQPIQH